MERKSRQDTAEVAASLAGKREDKAKTQASKNRPVS